MSTIDDTMKVTLTLRLHVAEKLRRICHAQNRTASEVIDAWVFEHDEKGNMIRHESPAGAAIRSAIDRIVGDQNPFR